MCQRPGLSPPVGGACACTRSWRHRTVNVTPCSSCNPCYACRIDPDLKQHKYGRYTTSWRIGAYEDIVEYIETQRGRVFSIAGVAKGLPHRSPAMWNMTVHVIRDLARHGLIECVKSSGKRCYGWMWKE